MAVAMKFALSIFNWTVAALIASLIAWLTLSMHTREQKPCIERPCYAKLDNRLGAIEAEMKVRTQDRYTGKDARRDLELVNKRIDNLHAELRKEK